jgi:hypothetical protein
VPKNPELVEFRSRTAELIHHPVLKSHLSGDEVRLAALTREDVAELIRDEVSYYFLIAAAGLNRTSLKRATTNADAQIVPPRLRRAFALKERLPVRSSFQATAETSVALREADLKRKRRGEVEQLFRDRLEEEGIPLLMSPPVRQVPGLLVSNRKPDGIYPDPATGNPPRLYLEVKNVQRVADDIQKRLYEIAEASIEMKAIYGRLRLEGLEVESTLEVAGNSELRAALRQQIIAADPVVVALLLCPKAEAERYREGAQTFIDQVFFQEEIQECLDFLRDVIARHQDAP